MPWFTCDPGYAGAGLHCTKQHVTVRWWGPFWDEDAMNAGSIMHCPILSVRVRLTGRCNKMKNYGDFSFVIYLSWYTAPGCPISYMQTYLKCYVSGGLTFHINLIIFSSTWLVLVTCSTYGVDVSLDDNSSLSGWRVNGTLHTCPL